MCLINRQVRESHVRPSSPTAPTDGSVIICTFTSFGCKPTEGYLHIQVFCWQPVWCTRCCHGSVFGDALEKTTNTNTVALWLLTYLHNFPSNKCNLWQYSKLQEICTRHVITSRMLEGSENLAHLVYCPLETSFTRACGVRVCIFIPQILTFTSCTSLRMKVLCAWSWDVITLTGTIERSIRIMAVWVWSAGLSSLTFINVWNRQKKSSAPDISTLLLKWHPQHNSYRNT